MVKLIATKVQNEAIDFEAEHVLVKGAPGSGKTTVLLFKVMKVLSQEPDAKLLLVTYNKTLTKYVKDFFEAREIDTKNISILTFHSWAWRVLKQIDKKAPSTDLNKVDEIFETVYSVKQKNSTHRFYQDNSYKKFLKEEISWLKGKGIVSESDYVDIKRSGRQVSLKKSDRKEIYSFLSGFESILKAEGLTTYDDYAILLDKKINVIPVQFKYDYILIDEAQDLTQAQLSLLRKLNPKSLIVSADMGQRIYNTDFTWKSVGINVVGGRTKSLEEMHRSCYEIVKLAEPLYNNDLKLNKMKSVEDQGGLTLPTRRSGLLPELHLYEDTNKEFQGIVDTISSIWKSSDKDITIGVLTRHKRNIYPLKKMISRNIPVEIIEKDKGSSLTPGIKLVTMHSAKGLEFDVVLIARLNEGHLPSITKGTQGEEVEEIVANDRRLLYVSMTRAKHQLVMTAFGTSLSRFIEEINKDCYKILYK